MNQEEPRAPEGAGQSVPGDGAPISSPAGGEPASGGPSPRRNRWRAWREKFRDRDWLKAAAAKLILAAAGIVALVLLLTGERTGGGGFFQRFARRTSPVARPGGAAPAVTLWAQPTGDVKNVMPSEVVFKVSDSVSGEPGVMISSAVAGSCVQFTPEAPGRIVWATTTNFSYRFLQPLKALTRYTYEVRCIPVNDNSKVMFPARSFYFSTPPFGVLNAHLMNWSGSVLSARVNWILPIQYLGMENYISVRTANGTPAKIVEFRRTPDQQGFIVSFKNVGKEYVLTVERAFSAAVPGMKLEEDLQIPLAIPERELVISHAETVEGEDGFTMTVTCTTSGSEACALNEARAAQFIALTPPLKTRLVFLSNGFQMVGDFLPEQTYDLTIRAGLMTQDAVLKTDYHASLKIPAMSPRVRFAVRGRYLGRKLGVKLPLRTRAVPKLSVSVWRLPRENVVWWGNGGDWAIQNYGEPVVKDREIPTEGAGGTLLTWLDLTTLMDSNEGGVYLVSAQKAVGKKKRPASAGGDESDEEGGYGDEGYWSWEDRRRASDRAVVIITDLALIAKKSDDRVGVWAVDATTAEPRAGAHVSLFSQKNVTLGTCLTDSEGFCQIRYEKVRDREPTLITAKREGDFTYLHLSTSALSVEPFSVSGFEPAGTNYRAYFYPERDLYRPGETLHFAVVVREQATFKGLQLPVRVNVQDSRGKRIAELTQTTDEVGLASFSLPLAASAATGKYSFEAVIADQSVAYGGIFVETFVPERMRVDVATGKDSFQAGEAIPFKIQADYLFGAPASGESYKFHCVADEGSFTARAFSDYRFGGYRDWKAQPPHLENSGEGTTGNTGGAEEECGLTGWSRFVNEANLRITAEVGEADSGRVSRGWVHVTVHPFPYYIGLKSASSRLSPNSRITVQGVTVATGGILKKDVSRLAYQVYEIRYEYVRVWDPDNNRFSWEDTRRKYPTEAAGELRPKDGQFELSFVPTTYWYNYLVEVKDPDGGSVGDLLVYGWGWSGEGEKPESPEYLSLRLNRTTAGYGDTVEAKALLPFNGKILWTVELDDVMKHQWQAATGEVSKFSFQVPRGVSTAYVSALLIRSDEQYLVRRAFGVERLKVRPAEHRLDLTIDAPETMKPGRDLAITVRGKGRFKATVAIVDEGILNITRFASPDVYEGIFTDQALSVETSETLGWIINKALLMSGGGEAPKMEMPSFIRLVSYWSGLVESDGNGRLRVKFPVPEYFGKLRIMVSALTPDRLGSAQADVTVTTDVVVLPTPPRFVYAEDSARFPVALKNTTDRAQKVRLRVVVDGKPIATGLPPEIALEPRGSRTLQIPLKVETLAGVSEIAVSADWGTDRYTDTLRFPVLPNRPFETATQYLEIKGKALDLRGSVKDWLPAYQQTRVTLTPIPALARLYHLKYLIQYPYGCVEQTSSTLLPMVRLKPLIELVEPDAVAGGELENRVNAGIARLISMQTPTGGFSFWPGGTDPAPWPSIYATFTLLEAKDAGFFVPDSTLNGALNYIEQYARGTAFGYFVLAKAGRLSGPDLESVVKLSETRVYSEDRLFLAAALQLGGRTATAQRVMMKALAEQNWSRPRVLYEDLYSPLREHAITLYVEESVNAGAAVNEADTMALVRLLGKQSYYYSTQELAWSILALGQRIRNAKYAREFTATLVADGKALSPVKSDQGLSWTVRSASARKELKLNVQASGVLYAFVENVGFPANARYAPVSEGGLAVRKRFLDLNGQPVTSFHQKKTYFVELEVVNGRQWRLDNVAIEDFLPAGFEIENPRLPGTYEGSVGLNRSSRLNADYVDYRDERLQVFGTLPYYSGNMPNPTFYYYVVRAVTVGDFFLPPVKAMVMYDPEIRAASDAGRIQVER